MVPGIPDNDNEQNILITDKSYKLISNELINNEYTGYKLSNREYVWVQNSKLIDLFNEMKYEVVKLF